MKKLKAVLLCIIAITSISACSNKNAKTETFKVWGNCEMCKETIESSLKKTGIIKADWDKGTKVISIKFDTTQTNLASIHQYIAASGYDTEMLKGNDSSYAHLRECCQYERKK